MEDEKRIHLSKSILEMKFMKRTKERVQKEQEDAEGKAMYSNEITEEMKKCEGRLSFGGMNPEIEKLMTGDYDKKKQEAEKKKETDVSDIQMAQEYSTLVDTMANKFSGKKNRTKTKFLKPSDDF